MLVVGVIALLMPSNPAAFSPCPFSRRLMIVETPSHLSTTVQKSAGYYRASTQQNVEAYYASRGNDDGRLWRRDSQFDKPPVSAHERLSGTNK